MDTIERHFASDLLDVIKEKVDKGEPFHYENAKRFIEKLPSAQPEIIYCKDCVHNIEPEFGFCEWANHHVSANSCCADVFHAERRTDG